MSHANSVVATTFYTPAWYCLDYQAAGLQLSPRLLAPGARDTTATHNVADGGEDEDQLAQAEADAERAAQLRWERRKVVTLNRMGEAAAHGRREFVTKLLTRKTPPKGAAIFVADCLIRDSALINGFHGSSMTAKMLGVFSASAVKKLVSDLAPTADGRAQVVTLGLVLGALEARTPKDSWRYGGYHGVKPVDYLKFLAANSYELAEVEQVIIGERTSEEVYEDYCS
jgi:ParB family chromosome partitioning protein